MLTELGSVMSFVADSAPAFYRVSVGTSCPDFPKLGIIHHILNLYILTNLHPLRTPRLKMTWELGLVEAAPMKAEPWLTGEATTFVGTSHKTAFYKIPRGCRFPWMSRVKSWDAWAYTSTKPGPNLAWVELISLAITLCQFRENTTVSVLLVHYHPFFFPHLTSTLFIE